MKHLTARPPLQRVPPLFRPVIEQALAKDPEQRIRSVNQLMRLVPTSPIIDPLRREEVIAAEIVGPVTVGDRRPTAPHPGSSDEGVAAGATATSPAVSLSTPEEPIARVVDDFVTRTRRGWETANLGTIPRVFILLVLFLALITNIGWLVPLGMIAGAAYLVYLLIRHLVLDSGPAPVAVAAVPTTPPANRPAAKRRRVERPWREVAREQLRAKSTRVRWAELLGSLLLSAIACLLLCLVMLIFASRGLDQDLLHWAPMYIWMTLTSIVGAWSILILGKTWEGSREEPALRRFAMLAVGLMVGLASHGLAQALQVQPTYLLEAPRSFHEYPTVLYENNGTPNLLGYLGYFAGLFVVLRWWRQVDPLRNARLSIFATFLYVLWAIVLFAFLPFPQGFLVAAAMSIAVQLAAPRMPDRQRRQLREAWQEI
jgi:threonine/homoserine/homoserine lactone efflux protein